MWTTTLKRQHGPTLAHEQVEETISQEDEAFCTPLSSLFDS